MWEITKHTLFHHLPDPVAGAVRRNEGRTDRVIAYKAHVETPEKQQ